MDLVQLFSVMEDVQQTEAKHIHNVNSEREEEQKEITIIPPPNAVVHPWAVMVKRLNTNTHVYMCLDNKKQNKKSQDLNQNS